MPKYNVLITINQNVSNYSDIFCVAREKGTKSHWDFHEHIVSNIVIDVPKDMLGWAPSGDLNAYFEVVEALDGIYRYDLVDASSRFDLTTGQWILSNIKLDGEGFVSRIFVLRKKA